MRWVCCLNGYHVSCILAAQKKHRLCGYTVLWCMKMPAPAVTAAPVLFDRLVLPAASVDFSTYQPLLQTAHLLLPPDFCRRGLLHIEVLGRGTSSSAGLSLGVALRLFLGADVLEVATPTYMATTSGETLHARLAIAFTEGEAVPTGEGSAGPTLPLPAWSVLQPLPTPLLGARQLRLELKNRQPATAVAADLGAGGGAMS